MIEKYHWLGESWIQIGSYPLVHYVGRIPFHLNDPTHIQLLIDTGVFKLLPDGLLKYIGSVTIQKKDKSKVIVDEEGFCETDLDIDFDESKKIKLLKELKKI